MEYTVDYSADIDRWSLWDWRNGGNTIINQLKEAAAKAQGRDKIILRLSSAGGDVFAGYEISNSIKTLALTKNVVVQNTSLCASIASIIAISGTTAEAYKNSLLMMHKPTVWSSGDDVALLKDAETLQKIEGQLVRSYADKIYSTKGGDYNKILENVKSMVKAETWLTAEEALAMGLIDAIIDDKALTMEEIDKRKKALEQIQLEQQQQAQNSQNAPKGSPVGGKPEGINAQNAQIKAKFLAKQTAATPVEPAKQTEEGVLAKLKEALKPLANFLGWRAEEKPAPKKVENNADNTAAPKEEKPAEQTAPTDENDSQNNQSTEEDMPLTTEDYKKIAIEVANVMQAQNNQQPPANQTPPPAPNNQQPAVENNAALEMQKKLEEAQKRQVELEKQLEARNAGQPPVKKTDNSADKSLSLAEQAQQRFLNKANSCNPTNPNK